MVNGLILLRHIAGVNELIVITICIATGVAHAWHSHT